MSTPHFTNTSTFDKPTRPASKLWRQRQAVAEKAKPKNPTRICKDGPKHRCCHERDDDHRESFGFKTRLEKISSIQS